MVSDRRNRDRNGIFECILKYENCVGCRGAVKLNAACSIKRPPNMRRLLEKVLLELTAVILKADCVETFHDITGELMLEKLPISTIWPTRLALSMITKDSV